MGGAGGLRWCPGWCIHGPGAPGLRLIWRNIMLANSPKYSNRSLNRENRPAAAIEGGNGTAAAGTKEDATSPLLAAAREFSLRMDPPPKPKPIAPKSAPVVAPPPAVAAPAVVEEPKPLEYGSLCVNIAPELDEAEWRISGGPWQKTGTTVEKIEIGTRVVEFKPVAGFDTPGSLTVQITKDQLARQEATYNKTKPPKPPAPQVTLTGTIVRGAQDSIVWVRLPGKNRDSVYFTGDEILGYKLTVVSDGAAVLVKDGYDFTVKMVLPMSQGNQPAMGQMPAPPPQVGRRGRVQPPPPPQVVQPAEGQAPPPPPVGQPADGQMVSPPSHGGLPAKGMMPPPPEMR